MEEGRQEGVITVEEGSGLDNELDVVEGMQFDRGYLSRTSSTTPSRWADGQPSSSCCTTRRSPTSANCCRCWKRWPGRQAAADRGGRSGRRSAGDPGGQHHPRHRQGLRGQGPGFGDRRKAMLEDMAILTNGTVIRKSACRWRRPPSLMLGAKDPGVEGKHHHHRRRRRSRRHPGPHRPDQGADRGDHLDYDREKLQERVWLAAWR